MASISTSNEIDSVFVTCPICHEYFEDPKTLPCLHCFCHRCLESNIEKDKPSFACLLCRETCRTPLEGPDQLETDIHMEQMVRCHQLHKKIADNDRLVCVRCSRLRPFSAYCFKCEGFLCGGCTELHLSSRVRGDHKQKLLTLKAGEEQDLTLERFASLRDQPRCPVQNEVFTNCCITCDNLPVCTSCSYMDHVGHDVYRVETVSDLERERVSNKLQVLKEKRELVYTLKNRADRAKAELEVSIENKRERLQTSYERQAGDIKSRLEENRAEMRRRHKEVNEFQKSVTAEYNRKKDEEMLAVVAKYQSIFDWIAAENGSKKDRIKRHHDRLDAMISFKGEILDNYFNDLSTDLEAKGSKNLSEIEVVREHSTNTIRRLENLDLYAASIIASENTWTDARRLPEVSTAVESLTRSVVKDFPEVDNLSDFTVKELPLINVDNGTISEGHECVDIDGLNSKRWEVNCISTSHEEERVVVTGKATEDYSHITVVNLSGKTQRQVRRRKARVSTAMPFRFCAHLGETKFVTACQSLRDDIGIYDIRKGSYIKKDTSGLPIESGLDWQVSCLATDPIRKRLLVGSFYRRELQVFDEKNKYMHLLGLPDVIKWPRDIAVFGTNLIVCDDENKMAYVVTMPAEPATQCEIAHCVPQPAALDRDCRPLSVCTDNMGYVYMLWDVKIRSLLTTVLAQYSRNGRQLLTKRLVDEDSRCLATLRTDEGEKLLMATERSGKMYIFDLSTSAEEQV